MIGKILTIAENEVLVELTEPVKFKAGEKVDVSRRKHHRTIQQNSFYWAYLAYCIKHGLKDHGHYSVDALHDDIKAWARESHGKTFSGDFSTADLGILEFQLYFELIDHELMGQFIGIDTSRFHDEYAKFCEWKQYNPEGSFTDYMQGGK